MDDTQKTSKHILFSPKANTGMVYFRVVEAMAGDTFTLYVGSFTSPGIDTR